MSGPEPFARNEPPASDLTARDIAEETEGLQPGDTYQDGPYLVFTAQFHLRRGFCCNSGCRHCPYRAVCS